MSGKKKRKSWPIFLSNSRGRKAKPFDNPLQRHPKGRIPIRANRVDAEIETEIGDVEISFGFQTAELAEDFVRILLKSYATRGATLIQHGKFKGSRDGAGS